MNATVASEPLLSVCELSVRYGGSRQAPPIRAVDGVDLAVHAHETVGLVGESGSGKSTIGNAILGLAPIRSGRVCFDGAEITSAGFRQRRALSAQLQVVFQNPYGSLNPAQTIGRSLREVLRPHGIPDREAVDRMRALLARVGFPAAVADRYPAEFSGGQLQRIAIARALMVQPRLIICDEVVSALDLSVQAQVLNLFRELQEELALSYLFISHDLSVVRHVSHRIVVLYRGRVMEDGPTASVYASPAHPYTQMLLEAEPVPDPDLQRQRRAARTRRASSGRRADASPAHPSGEGCPFAARCPHALDVCRSQRPALETTPAGTTVSCHRWRELASSEAIGRPAAGHGR